MASRVSRSNGFARSTAVPFATSLQSWRSGTATAGERTAGERDAGEREAGRPATTITKSRTTDDSDGAVRARRVLLVASAGGHWIELCRLSPAFAEFDCLFVSTAGGLTDPLSDKEVVQIADSSRDSAWTMMRTMGNIIPVVRKFRPDILVSTGAAPGALALFIGKLYGVHTIWIDSIANSEAISLSGKIVKLAADLRLTQWPQLASDRRRLYYFGKIL